MEDIKINASAYLMYHDKQWILRNGMRDEKPTE